MSNNATQYTRWRFVLIKVQKLKNWIYLKDCRFLTPILSLSNTSHETKYIFSLLLLRSRFNFTCAFYMLIFLGNKNKFISFVTFTTAKVLFYLICKPQLCCGFNLNYFQESIQRILNYNWILIFWKNNRFALK